MIAFTYPGQGSQEPAMGEPWKDHPSWEIVSEVAEATERDIAYLLLDADKEELRQTHNSQLATFTLSMVVLDAVTRVGLAPNSHAGHSLGEFSALTASGILSLADAAQVVAERGNAMQMAAQEKVGTMAAVLGLEDQAVEEICKEMAPAEVWVANYNSPGQVVIAGEVKAIDAASKLAKEKGAKKVIPLPIGGAFHTPFMESARERLLKAVSQAEFRNPDAPIYANVDAQPYDKAAPWQDLIGQQLCSPVRWSDILLNLKADGHTTLVELGAGKVLTGMAKRVSSDFQPIAVNLPEGIDNLLSALGHPPAALGEGEHLYATERLIVSPRAGVFEPSPEMSVGESISVGAVLGSISGEEVNSLFEGTIMGYMALPGERVTVNQPLVWLQTKD